MTFRLTLQDPPQRRSPAPRETKTHLLNPDSPVGATLCGRLGVEVAGGAPTCEACLKRFGGVLPGQIALPSAVTDPDPLPW